MLVTPLGELTIRTFRGCRLGSEGGMAGRGVSGSEVWSESGIKSSVTGIYLLLLLLFHIRNNNNLTLVLHIRNIYSVMSL